MWKINLGTLASSLRHCQQPALWRHTHPRLGTSKSQTFGYVTCIFITEQRMNRLNSLSILFEKAILYKLKYNKHIRTRAIPFLSSNCHSFPFSLLVVHLLCLLPNWLSSFPTVPFVLAVSPSYHILLRPTGFARSKAVSFHSFQQLWSLTYGWSVFWFCTFFFPLDRQSLDIINDAIK